MKIVFSPLRYFLRSIIYSVFGWDDIIFLLASTALSKASTPDTSSTSPGEAPQGQQMDLNALLSTAQQPKQEQPKLQLQNRLPRPNNY